MSKGLTAIAFVFLLPFVVIATLWIAARRRGVPASTTVSPGSAQGNAPQGATRTATNSAQGNAPGGSGTADLIRAGAEAVKAAQPIVQGFLDAFVNSNSDYTPDESEANIAADPPIEAPFWESLNVF